MDPHLARLQQEVTSAAAAFSPETLDWHPPQKWSAAQIFEHLYLTYTGTTKGFQRLLESGQPQPSTATLKRRLQAFIVTGLGYLPSGRKSPPAGQPRGLPSAKIMSEIAPKIAEMDDVLTRCASTFGSRTKVLDHPLLGPFSVAQWRKFHLVHGEHHVRQLKRLRESIHGHTRSSQK